jgi:hypothetical protein
VLEAGTIATLGSQLWVCMKKQYFATSGWWSEGRNNFEKQSVCLSMWFSLQNSSNRKEFWGLCFVKRQFYKKIIFIYICICEHM